MKQQPLPDTAPPIPHPNGGRLPTPIAEQIHENRASTRRTARFHRCRRCGAIVLTGLDGDVLAWTATADPTPINAQAELAVLLLLQRTYRVDHTREGYHLTYRHPAHRGPGTVLPAHACGRRFPGFLTPPAQEHTHADQPPY